MSLSEIGKSVGESVTLKLNQTAAMLTAKGEPVIHLGGGEPKSKAPLDAILSATAVINSGEVRYTPADGILPLKQAIISYTEEFYHKKFEPKNVIASGGAKQSIMVALQAIINPGDEVVYPSPYWVSYPEMLKLIGGVGVPVLAADKSFYPKIQDIEKHITKKTKAVIINSPNNPTGAMYSEEFISDVVALCEKKDLWLIMDDIYHRLIFDGKKPISVYKFAKNDSKIIVINGVSKQYAMTGFRIGWAVGNPELVEAMKNIQAHQTSGPSVVLQKAAVAAINGEQSCVESLRLTLENNRNVMMSHLSSFKDVKANKPEGTFYCFVDFSKYEPNSVKLADFLLEKVMVVTVPGSEFGLDGHLRLSTCGTVADITQGISRIKWALDPDAPKELVIGDKILVRDWK